MKTDFTVWAILYVKYRKFTENIIFSEIILKHTWFLFISLEWWIIFGIRFCLFIQFKTRRPCCISVGRPYYISVAIVQKVGKRGIDILSAEESAVRDPDAHPDFPWHIVFTALVRRRVVSLVPAAVFQVSLNWSYFIVFTQAYPENQFLFWVEFVI